MSHDCFCSMTASLQRPHMSLSDEIYVEKAWKIAPGIKFLAVLIKAVSKGLEKYPALNAVSKVDATNDTVDLTQKASHNIGFAMDTSSGLVVPVIHNVQNLSVSDIQNQLNMYKEQTSFERSQLTNATFTLSNIGSTGAGLHATAVLGGDAVAMGVVGRKHVTPVYKDGSFVPTSTVQTSWTADHRFVDGATLAKFHVVVRGYVEEPTTLLAELR